jgi:hypothetical protein
MNIYLTTIENKLFACEIKSGHKFVVGSVCKSICVTYFN